MHARERHVLVRFCGERLGLRLIRPKHLDLFVLAGTIEEALEMIANPAAAEKDTDKWWRETTG